jgi:phosphoribosyl-AMP cyclohydrolase
MVEGTQEQLAFEKMGGLIPAVIQDHGNGDVLMMGFVNAESMAATQKTGEVHFFSRSRNKLWKKGETSGHVLRVREIRVDCDADALLIRVDAVGPGVCHEGYRSCFFRTLESDRKLAVVDKKVFEAESVYGKKESQ